jgi:ABC-2 type transport system permease protein
MNKVQLIITREYLSRVRKKSFIIMTIVGPLLMGGIFASVFLLNRADTEIKKIVIVDDSHLFEGKFKSNESVEFTYSSANVNALRKSSKDSSYFGVLHIPPATNLASLEKAVILYSESTPGIDLLSRIKFTLEKEINTSKYVDAGIDEKKLQQIKTNVDIQTHDMENNKTYSSLYTAVGFAGGLLIYMFIFIYGAMVMRGVLEEKTSRIVEVIISSVKPFQLMLGKIIGIALVGLTQFLLWIVLTFFVFQAVSISLNGGKSQQEQMQEMMVQQKMGGQATNVEINDSMQSQVMEAIDSLNLPLLIGMFLFYFIGGYLLYSALFAAIGAAADSETDTQQFMLPVTIPLVLGYIASTAVINNPQGNVAFWFSIIPFTSPIVMMVRIPFGVPVTDVVLSVTLLIAGFLFTTWLAAKIYRTGILMYGKKVNYRELLRWLTYKG